MPLHDWTRVTPGTYHDFHLAWIASLGSLLNQSLLPTGYYALVERSEGLDGDETAEPDIDFYRRLRNSIAIRRENNDSLVAAIEITVPGILSRNGALTAFIGQAIGCISGGIHVVLVDPFPPHPNMAKSLHGRIWERLTGNDAIPTPGKDRTLVTYQSGSGVNCYVESLTVGDTLREMPLFLEEKRVVELPLETAYISAYRGMPRKYKAILEA